MNSMSRRWMALFCALALCLGLAACDRDREEDGDDGPTWREQYDLGVRYLEDGNYEEAVIAFTAAIEIDPQRPGAYVGLADAYVGLGDEDSARSAVQQGIDACGEDDTLTAWLADHPAEDAPEDPEEPESPEDPETPEEPEDAELWILTHQAAWLQSGEETWYYDVDYTYNGDGYLTSCAETSRHNDRTTTRQETWTYSGPGVAWYTPDRNSFETEEEWLAAQEERAMIRGTCAYQSGRFVSSGGDDAGTGVIMDPLLDEEHKQAVLTAGGRDEPEAANTDVVNSWSRAQYTFDEHGNAVHIDTYGLDGSLTGSCDLTWELCPGTGENP